MPGLEKWGEISSCSNCTDFQAWEKPLGGAFASEVAPLVWFFLGSPLWFFMRQTIDVVFCKGPNSSQVWMFVQLAGQTLECSAQGGVQSEGARARTTGKLTGKAWKSVHGWLVGWSW